MTTNQSWSLHTQWECIWRNPFDPAVVGNLGRGLPGNDTYIEITAALPEGGPGNWVNVVPGSGVFMHLPAHETLVARNKIDALVKLGMSVQDIANTYGDSFTWNGWGGAQNFRQNIDFIKSEFGIETLAELLAAVANNTKNIIALEWVGDCPVLDQETYHRARKKGYDFVQYYCTGYQGCFWANEIMCTLDGDFGQLAHTYMFTTTSRCPSMQSAPYLQCSIESTKLSPPSTSGILFVIMGVIIATIALIFLRSRAS